MNKLLSANFFRLWRSKIFYVIEILSVAAGIIMYSLVVINTKNLGENWLFHNSNAYFFVVLVYIGGFMAAFSSFFIGTEYTDGTIRNKLFVGHTRRDVYLSNLIVNFAAGLCFTLSHMLASILTGLPFLGRMILDTLSPMGWRVPCAVLVIFCYAAIFTFLSMLDSNQSRSAAIGLLLALAIGLGGLYTFGRIQETETTLRMVMQEDGSFVQEEVPNPHYLQGPARTACTLVDAMLPSSEAMRIADREGLYSVLSPVMLGAVSAAFIWGGAVLFEKKEIK